MNILSKHLLSVLLLAAYGCTSKYPGPLSPEESLESFQIHPDFEIQIFAAEPLITDPVCMEFDANGNIYVVEMYDYPYRPEKGKERGRIVQLIDENGDGRIDGSSVFADKLMEATSILPWDGGLLVTAAPNILYLKDTDGDGKADVRKALFSGFFAANSEAQITSLRFGVDNWIYASNNGRAGKVTSSMDADAPPLEMSGADFRFRMDTEEFERVTGSGQFGQDLDENGNRFYTQNTLHIQQNIMPWKYWHRHPNLPSFRASENISDHELEMFQLTPPPYWRAERTKRRNEDFQSRNLDRVEYAEDKFTGASGGTIYAGNGFGDEYGGNVFTGDVAGNLVHRDILTVNTTSPALIAQRADEEQEREFLASTDPWFRPTNFAQGPDGMLYVLDYYRQHIETPLSIPEDLKAEMDFMYGSEHGRIYRIQPKRKENTWTKTSLSQAGSSELVNLLAHPNGWHRSTAQRLILERQDSSIVPQLQALFENSDNPKARIRALYALEGLGSLTTTNIEQALKDVDPNIRKAGLVLAEKEDNGMELILPVAKDSDARVAFQAALSLGNYQGREVQDALADILLRFSNDCWYIWAVLSAETGSSQAFFELLIDKGYLEKQGDGPLEFAKNYAFVAGAKNDAEQVKSLLTAIQQEPFANVTEVTEPILKSLIKGLIRNDEETEMAKKILSISEDERISSMQKIQALLALYQ
ncbi:MAG: dehydrogenase [Cyclobacteriaceae bacterium]